MYFFHECNLRIVVVEVDKILFSTIGPVLCLQCWSASNGHLLRYFCRPSTHQSRSCVVGISYSHSCDAAIYWQVNCFHLYTFEFRHFWYKIDKNWKMESDPWCGDDVFGWMVFKQLHITHSFQVFFKKIFFERPSFMMVHWDLNKKV